MIKTDEPTILIGLSEFREKAPELQKKMKDHVVILTKRGKPVAVLQDFTEYKRQEAILDEFEDMVLGMIAKERMETNTGEYITHEELGRWIKERKDRD